MDTTTLACGTNSRKVIPLSDIQGEITGISPSANEMGPSTPPSEGAFEKISAWLTNHWRAVLSLIAIVFAIGTIWNFSERTTDELSDLAEDIKDLKGSVGSTRDDLSKTLGNIDIRLDNMNTRLSHIEGRLFPSKPIPEQGSYTQEF